MGKTTLLDMYGSIDNAVSDLKKALRPENAWAELEGPYKVAFQAWITKHANEYVDGEKIDWIGAFYDWHEAL